MKSKKAWKTRKTQITNALHVALTATCSALILLGKLQRAQRLEERAKALRREAWG